MAAVPATRAPMWAAICFRGSGSLPIRLRRGGGPRRADLGRFAITGRESDRPVFRVPSLRNVAVTAPYFHDGRTASLNDAVRIMARSQLGRELTEREIRAIVKFLRTLTGEYRGRPLDRLAEGQAR